MRLFKLATLLSIAAGLLLGASLTADAAKPENTMIVTLKQGDVVIGLRPDLAPKAVAQIKALVEKGAYDHVVFHRVIDGFMAQTGDVEFGNKTKDYDAGRAGTGGSDMPDLPAEFSSEHFVRGTVGMARTATNENSANSQFFIMFAPAPDLDGQYTIIGKVESGMKYVDRITKGDPKMNGQVHHPDEMISVHMASDKK